MSETMYAPEGSYDKEDYEQFIKDYCVVCGTSIPATWKHYYSIGNFCTHCNTKAESRIKEKKVLRQLR